MRWKRWLSRSLLSLGLVMFVVGFVRFYTADWTGFEAKVLWDWLELLLIPAVLTGGGIWFTRSENRQAREIEEKRVVENRRIEEERLKEARKIEEQRLTEAREIEHGRNEDAILKDYLDQMTDLMLNHTLRDSVENSEVRSVARARTLTALRGIAGVRKATIIQFLYESRLIGFLKSDEASGVRRYPPIIDLIGANLGSGSLPLVVLIGADLSGVQLQDTNLMSATLSHSVLSHANFSGSCLVGSDLSGCILVRVTLYESVMRGANLTNANLTDSILMGADLSEARLSGVDLSRSSLVGAVLDEAILTDCKVTLDQLLQARSLHGTKLPEGINGIALGDKWSPPKDENTPEL